MENDKRKNYISKDEFFTDIARTAAKRSKDPNTQVGACIVSSDGRILSTGYNGFPNGISDDEYPWVREGATASDTKYPYVVHAELNAILNFKGNTNDLKGASLYVTLFPCHECAKAIIQSGISKIYYTSDKYNGTEDNMQSKKMLKDAGIGFIQVKPEFINMMRSIMNVTDILGEPRYHTSKNTPELIEELYNRLFDAMR